MLQNTREPATKTWGPRKAFGPIAPNSRVILQLYNLQPAAHWQPALEGELLAPHILPPFPNWPLWRLTTPNFQYSVWLAPDRIETVVFYNPTIALVYYSRRYFCSHQWNINENFPFARIYAVDGTATQSDAMV